jgi:hypothetical protein
MQNLKIKAELAGKTITRDLGYTKWVIEIDKLKKSQYGLLYQRGFTEIFENGEEEKREHTSNEVVEDTSGNDGVVEKVQETPKRKRKSKLA